MTEARATLNHSVLDLPFVTPNNSHGNFKELRGHYTILYFYPKDNTSGCTQEGIDFAELYPKFQALKAEIFGVSRDSLKSHSNFSCKYNFPFELISDSDEVLCDYFAVMKQKSMYGRQYLGVERSTFLIDDRGVLRQEWRNVKVPNHAQQVLDCLKNLIAG